MLLLYTTCDNVDEVVGCVGNAGWLLSVATKVVENCLTRLAYFAKVIRMTSGAESQYSIELGHVS